MNFPLDYPLFRLVYWLVDTAGIGGIIALLVGGGSLTIYLLTLRWIAKGGDVDDPETYVFPTSTLLDHDKAE
jgi:hypothetical protein